MNEPLTLQVARGQRAAADLRAAENLMSLMRQWDDLRYSEKLAEHAKGQDSRFHDVPGFEPAWCAICATDVILDYTQDPEGACGSCGTVAPSSMAAAA